MAYSLEVKNEAKKRLESGESAKQLSEQMGISTATLYKWKKELKIEEAKEMKKEEKEQVKEKTPIQPQKAEDGISNKEVKLEEQKDVKEEVNERESNRQAKEEGAVQSEGTTIRKQETRQQSREAKNEYNKRIKFMNEIKTKIYYDRIEEINIEEIGKRRDLAGYEKTAILLAIFEKQKDIKKAQAVVERYRLMNPKAQSNKTFNTIMQGMKSKKAKIFDYGMYDNLLHWKIDKDLQDKYKQEQRSKEKERKSQVKVATTKTPIEEAEIETKEEPSIIRPRKVQQRPRKSFKERIQVNQKIVNPIRQEEKEPNYYQGIVKYLTEKKNFIYVKMQSTDSEVQRQGIEQWDKMEVLMEKVNENRDNKEYLVPLYEKISQLKEKENGMDR